MAFPFPKLFLRNDSPLCLFVDVQNYIPVPGHDFKEADGKSSFVRCPLTLGHPCPVCQHPFERGHELELKSRVTIPVICLRPANYNKCYCLSLPAGWSVESNEPVPLSPLSYYGQLDAIIAKDTPFCAVDFIPGQKAGSFQVHPADSKEARDFIAKLAVKANAAVTANPDWNAGTFETWTPEEMAQHPALKEAQAGLSLF